MRRFRWPLLILLICLPVAILAAGFDLPWTSRRGVPVPRPVPSGDRELVWLHTTTNASTWERFVTGVRRAAADVPGLHVDDAQAFLDQTTDVPEVVVARDGVRGKLRIRWYKLNSYAKPSQWVEALAARNPAPLAIIGGGSSDRARDLARAMARQENWVGGRPLLFITTASAEKVQAELDDPDPEGESRELLKIYPGRTFRFCFGNRRMAEAMLDFIWQHPELRPLTAANVAPLAVTSTLADGGQPCPPVLYVDWNDDPYSSDLLEQFQDVLPTIRGKTDDRPDFFRWQVPFSVGGYYLPNRAEAEAADSILKELARMPGRRALLVIPTIPAPARRLLRTLCDADPFIGQQVVALNGDGIQVNTVLRDGEFAWPVSSLPVPLVMFTHSDPLGWDAELKGPSSTEDVLHFAKLLQITAEAALPTDAPPPATADDLAARLIARKPAFFDPSGRRLDDTGEYVVLLKPLPPQPGGGLPNATLQVWTRADSGWRMARQQPIHQSRAGHR